MIAKSRMICLIGVVFACRAALAAEVLVVDAKGVDLVPGQKIDGSKPLVLAVGQRVTLITADGQTIKLKGPSDAPPAPQVEENKGDVVDSLKGLIKSREANTSTAGVIRKGNAAINQPSPWLIEIEDSGDRCLFEGERTVFWRVTIPSTQSEMQITPIDHSWSASTQWPAGSDKLALPPSIRINNDQAYVVTIDGSSANLTMHILPKTVETSAAKAAWMIEKGCEAQARSLIDSMR